MTDLVVTIGGKRYALSELSDELQGLVRAYRGWEQELGEQRTAVFKTETALRAVALELEARVKAEGVRSPWDEERQAPTDPEHK